MPGPDVLATLINHHGSGLVSIIISRNFRRSHCLNIILDEKFHAGTIYDELFGVA